MYQFQVVYQMACFEEIKRNYVCDLSDIKVLSQVYASIWLQVAIATILLKESSIQQNYNIMMEQVLLHILLISKWVLLSGLHACLARFEILRSNLIMPLV